MEDWFPRAASVHLYSFVPTCGCDMAFMLLHSGQHWFVNHFRSIQSAGDDDARIVEDRPLAPGCSYVGMIHQRHHFTWGPLRRALKHSKTGKARGMCHRYGQFLETSMIHLRRVQMQASSSACWTSHFRTLKAKKMRQQSAAC